jgi:arginase family enzyme
MIKKMMTQVNAAHAERLFSTKVHVIGYPFAGGQPRGGTETTPDWLFRQPWFKDLCKEYDVTTEMVNVTSRDSNARVHPKMNRHGAKNWQNVMRSTRLLRWAVKDAIVLKDRFPLVIGGDHT